MTNSYNTFLSRVEHACGVTRRQTEGMLADKHVLSTPDWLLRDLLGHQDASRNWREEIPTDIVKAQAELQKIQKTIDIAGKIMSPVLSKETATGGLTNSGGNLLIALLDLWVQQDHFITGDHPPRHAHIVQYDMVNMEAVMKATYQMIGAYDRFNKHNNNQKRDGLSQFTDGYMRIVNGLVRDAFERKLIEKDIGISEDNVDAYVNLIRPSSGDEFRLAVAGLDDDEVKEAMQAAQKRVGRFISLIGFNALPHLKYLKDDQNWDQITSEEALKDPGIFDAFKYGGAGIKIGAVTLGEGRSTEELIAELDLRINENREERAEARAAHINKALAAKEYIFPSDHKDAAKHPGLLGALRFNNTEVFKHILKKVRQQPYSYYYRRPPFDRRDFPFDLVKERKFAYPANNPEHYIEKYIEIAKTYVDFSEPAISRLKIALKTAFEEMPFAVEHQPEKIAAIILKTIQDVYEEPVFHNDELIKFQLEMNEQAITDHLITFLGTHNSYECFDITRKRILDRTLDGLKVPHEHRAIVYNPLTFFNARDDKGICLSGRSKMAIEYFQSSDSQTRLLSYIGLSSFAGVNEISTSLGKSINEQIRTIAAMELKKHFGENVLDFAFLIDSGRLHLLTHGISSDQLVEALSAIEIRVENEINQAPLGTLLDRYRIFENRKLTKDEIIPLERNDRDAAMMSPTIKQAEEQFGEDTPIVYWNNQQGEMEYRPLQEDGLTTEIATMADAGQTIFLMRKIKDKAPIPEHVQTYLKANGYAQPDNPEQLDLNKPLANLPNAKFTHEKGVRVITGYVELLGKDPRLAGPAKGALSKIIEAKKRMLFAPGTGHSIELPVESNPHYEKKKTAPETEDAEPVVRIGTTRIKKEKHKQKEPEPEPEKESKPVTKREKWRNLLNSPTPPEEIPVVVESPANREEWYQRLDQEEFARIHKRQVPQTLLQLIADPSITVEKRKENEFKIKVSRPTTRYGGERTPPERAIFIRTALKELLFGINIAATGSLSKDRPISLHINIPKSVVNAEVAGDRPVSDPIKFMEDLVVFKSRQMTNNNASIPEGINGSLKEQDSKYAAEVKAIRLLRQYPTLQITHDRKNRRYEFIIPPLNDSERLAVKRDRAKKLHAELKRIFTEKAELEMLEPPTASMSGQKSKMFEVRVKENEVSKHVLHLMEDMQYPGDGPDRTAMWPSIGA